MNRLINLILLMGSMLLYACEDHRLDGMEPDKVYLAKSGLITESTYDLGEKVTAEYWTYKSGISGTTAVIEYKIDNVLLEAYNVEHGTTYDPLPENCYELGETRFTIGGKEMHAPFAFTYDPALIVAASEGVYESQEFVLPIRIISEGVEITDENPEGTPDQLLIVFDIKQPTLNILRGDFEPLTITAGQVGKVSYSFDVGMPFTSKWDVQFGFSTDAAVLDEAVDSYNTQIGSNYTLLPQSVYELVTADLSVAEGNDFVTAEVEIDREKIGLGNFVLPLVLSDISAPLFAGHDSVIFIPIQSAANRLEVMDTWEATASTFNAANPPANVIDGDPATFWHVVYKGQNGGLKDPDPWVMIDLKELRTIYQVEVMPTQTANIDGYEILTSETGEDGDWTGHGFHEASSPADKARTQWLFDLQAPTTTRFVKVRITNNQPSTGGNTVGVGEVYLRGI